MKAAVLGSGRWASFLAWYLQTIGVKTLLWGREGSGHLRELMETRKNDYIQLPPDVELTSDLGKALAFGDITLVAISAQQLRVLLREARAMIRGQLVLCMKGLEERSGLRLTQVAEQELGKAVPTAVWVGPGHPQDFVRGVPNCMVIDSSDQRLTRELADALTGQLIRFYYGEDLIGTEIGAAAKNVVGIAAGMLDGMGFSSLKGVLMARGAREISRLVGAMGGEEITIYGLCHLGDYEATLFSPHSHNRTFGECIVRGQPYGQLAEGAATAFSLMRLSELYGVELPICRAISKTLRGEVEPRSALTDLFARESTVEFYGPGRV